MAEGKQGGEVSPREREGVVEHQLVQARMIDGVFELFLSGESVSLTSKDDCTECNT